MTEFLATEGLETTEEQAASSAEEQAASPETVNCRHCGQPYELAPDADADWLCPACERYQDSMTCPTCSQVARISLMPAELAPEAHAPTRRRRTREES